jgi:SAM-dependent methyltransferase
MGDREPEWIRRNRACWDERVPLHAASAFYDVDGFRAGEPQVLPFEMQELGALGGLRLAHLQCHFGLDTLDLVRMHPNLTAVGLDFSAPAVEFAGNLAAELGLTDRATFVHADVHDAGSILGDHRFDVVYTGKGALNWLPDLLAWAYECRRLLRPGGFLYLCEFHPIGYTVGEQLADGLPTVTGDYFDTETIIDETPGSYTDPDAPTTNNLTYEWQHPISDVLNALIKTGLQLRFFREWDYTLFELQPWFVNGDDGRYRWPGAARLPLMYSLKAVLPEGAA